MGIIAWVQTRPRDGEHGGYNVNGNYLMLVNWSKLLYSYLAILVGPKQQPQVVSSLVYD